MKGWAGWWLMSAILVGACGRGLSSSIQMATTSPGPRLLRATAFLQTQTRGVKRLVPKCGLQVSIHIRGKRTGGEDWLNSAYGEYEKRLRTTIALETCWHKTDEDLMGAIKKSSQPCICLDENGRQLDSVAFSDLLYRKLEEGGSRLSFVIGGAEGLPPELKQRGDLLSLSKMTFTHQFARVVLAEQIYRAAEIRKGSSYHKE